MGKAFTLRTTTYYYVIWVCIHSVTLVDSAKILLLPASLYSHCLEVSSVGQELANRGHNVSIFIGSNFEAKDCYTKQSEGKGYQIRPIIYTTNSSVPSPAEMSNEITQVVKDGELEMGHNMAGVFKFVRYSCLHILHDKEAILRLKDEKFDLVVIDGFFFTYCMYAIPYTIGVPYVSVSTIFDGVLIGRPSMFSVVPSIMTQFTDRMTFPQRLLNGLSMLVLPQVTYWSMPIDVVSNLTPELSTRDVLNLVSKSQLFLSNHDNVLCYPAPLMPNEINVGGLATQPAKPLTGTIKDFYKASKSGVIVVTFGSSFGRLPARVEKIFHATLNRVKTNILWKYVSDNLDGHILKSKWIPQNDVLGDPKTKLFISHCGNNGFYEALYHGVPILCTPIFGDQMYNAARVKHFQVGSSLSMFKATEETLYEAIIDVLYNSTYRDNMKTASAIFHSQPMTPRERAAYWIEHVLKFGGEHLRSRGSDISVFTFMGYDIVCFLCSLCLAVVVLSYKFVSDCCKSRKTNKEKLS